MKFVLFKNYGSVSFNKDLKEKLSRHDFPFNRSKAVSYVETNGKSLGQYGEGVYYIIDNASVLVQDIDTSRPWTICEYDGQEYVQYLDYQIAYSKINYCELPRE